MPKKSKQSTPHLRIRIEPELLARLETSRKTHGRTLTGEIVHRIEQSFRKSEDANLAAETFRAALGGPTGDLLRAIATAIWLIEKRTGKKWNEDPLTVSQVWLATGALLEGFVFPFNAERAFRHFKQMMPSEMLMPFLSRTRIGIDAALAVLQKMDMAPSAEEIDEAGKKIEARTRTADNNRSEQ